MIAKYFKSIRLVMFASILMYSCAALIEASEVDNRIFSYENGIPNEPGKCFAKCLIHDSYDLVEHDIWTF